MPVRFFFREVSRDGEVPDKFFDFLGGRFHLVPDRLVECHREGFVGNDGCVHLTGLAGEGAIIEFENKETFDLRLLKALGGGLGKTGSKK